MAYLKANPDILVDAWLEALKDQDLEEDLPLFGGAWMGFDDAWPSDASDSGWRTFSQLVRARYGTKIDDIPSTSSASHLRSLAEQKLHIDRSQFLSWASTGGYEGGVGTGDNESTVNSYVEAFNSILDAKAAFLERIADSIEEGVTNPEERHQRALEGSDLPSVDWD